MISEKQKLIDKIQGDIRSGKEIVGINGAFGDIENCEGYVEEVIKLKEGGTLSKLYGCSYLFKGYPVQTIVEGIGLAKSLISAIPRRILSKSILLQISLILMYFFSRKRFFHYFYVYTSLIYFHIMMKINMPLERYNTATKELRRALFAAIDKIAKKNRSNFNSSQISCTFDSDKIMENEFWNSLVHLSTFICLFLEYDNAYRFPLQDIFTELNKDNVKKSVIDELNRLFKIFGIRASTETKPLYKIFGLKKLLIGALSINKQLRETIKEFLLEVDIDKIKMDEHDKYFSLNRIGYNFGGISYEERLKEKKRIDKEKGHLRVQMMNLHISGQATGTSQLGLKVINENI